MKEDQKYYAWYWKIPCYIYLDDNSLIGRNLLTTVLLGLAITIETVVVYFVQLINPFFISEGYKIEIGEKVKKRRSKWPTH